MSPTNTEWEYYYYKKDHVGNVRVLMRGSGSSVSGFQRTNYYPFGSVHGRYQNLQLNRHLFSGKELEDAALGPQGMVGWYDYGARMYNPHYGRWLSQDPFARKYVTLSPYGYCGNNPICNIDPTGMQHWTVTEPEKIQEVWKLLLAGDTEGMKNYVEKNGDMEGASPLGSESDEYHLPGGSYPGNGWGSKGRSPGEIKPYEPNAWGKMERFLKQNGLLGHLIYNLTLKNIDDIWIVLQSFAGRTYPAHLNRNGVSPQEKLEAGFGTMTNIFFWNCGIMQGIPEKTVNASQFNQLHRGTGITAASQGGAFIRQYNYIIRNNNEFIRTSNFTGNMLNYLTSCEEINY